MSPSERMETGKGNNNSGEHIAGLVLARGGSVGIPKKNIRCLSGFPLITWILRPMAACKKFASLWVSTDDQEISDIAAEWGARIHHRKVNTACETSSSLIAVQEFLSVHPEITVVALVQCTSPCLSPKYLEIACEMILQQGYDSVFSVMRQHKLRWKEVSQGENTKPLNFDAHNRPRRQDWEGELIESGHFYISKVPLIKEGYLQGKRCGYIEFPKEMCIEIDSESDWPVAEQLVKLYGWKGT